MARILIVEDAELSRRMVEQLLRMDGYETTTAVNGIEALQSLQTSKPDLILLDVMMPEMDGLTFLEKMRENPDWRELPVIIMSALFDDATIARAQNLGAKEYLVKARCSAQVMLEHIRTQLDARPPVNH